ncbi:hypothetical protein C8F01DRAFT_1271361 [Mycena amicta]|nr:hypothetical protein C8F01DRAFT_1271361 [Mycena amicta]
MYADSAHLRLRDGFGGAKGLPRDGAVGPGNAHTQSYRCRRQSFGRFSESLRLYISRHYPIGHAIIEGRSLHHWVEPKVSTAHNTDESGVPGGMINHIRMHLLVSAVPTPHPLPSAYISAPPTLAIIHVIFALLGAPAPVLPGSALSPRQLFAVTQLASIVLATPRASILLGIVLASCSVPHVLSTLPTGCRHTACWHGHAAPGSSPAHGRYPTLWRLAYSHGVGLSAVLLHARLLDPRFSQSSILSVLHSRLQALELMQDYLRLLQELKNEFVHSSDKVLTNCDWPPNQHPPKDVSHFLLQRLAQNLASRESSLSPLPKSVIIGGIPSLLRSQEREQGVFSFVKFKLGAKIVRVHLATLRLMQFIKPSSRYLPTKKLLGG